MLASQWVWQRTKSVSIPAEEQNAGRVVDYFYRMEFHITPRFFSDSNYLFFFLSARRGANISIAAIIGGKYASVGSLPFREKEKVAYRAPAAQNL